MDLQSDDTCTLALHSYYSVEFVTFKNKFISPYFRNYKQ